MVLASASYAVAASGSQFCCFRVSALIRALSITWPHRLRWVELGAFEKILVFCVQASLLRRQNALGDLWLFGGRTAHVRYGFYASIKILAYSMDTARDTDASVHKKKGAGILPANTETT